MIVRVNRLATPHSEADVSANGWTAPHPTNPPEAEPAGAVRLRCGRPAGGEAG